MGNAYIKTISLETFTPALYRGYRTGKCYHQYLTLKNGLQIITGSTEILAASVYLSDIYIKCVMALEPIGKTVCSYDFLIRVITIHMNIPTKLILINQ